MAKNIKLAPVLGLLILLPFIALEIINKRNYTEGFPVLLFFFLWLHQTVFLLIFLPVVQNLRSGKSLMKNPLTLLIRAVLLVIIAYAWVNVILDQWPCFMGVPNCD